MNVLAKGLHSGARDTHRHHVQVRLHWEGEESVARAGLYLLVQDVFVCGKITSVILQGVVSPEMWSSVAVMPFDELQVFGFGAKMTVEG